MVLRNTLIYFIGFILLFSQVQTNAQNTAIAPNKADTEDVQLQITIYLKGNYTFEADVLISESNLLFVNIEDLFKSLKIKSVPDINGFVGFIGNEDNPYKINFETKKILIKKKKIDIADGLIQQFGIKYIDQNLLSKAFGLNFDFNPRSLSAKLTPNFELAFLKQLRIEKTKNNISRLRKEAIVADTIIPRKYHLFKFGALDWTVQSSQTTKTGNKNTNSASVSVGTELLFGAATFSTAYSDQTKFNIEQLQYDWRWINNDNKIIKQAVLGKISSQNISQLKAPLVGVSINNSSNTIRKASGYFNITDTTEPNWKVELYMNEILIDFTEADATGLYIFKVPIVYGLVTLRLKFYGPLGEERSEERTRNTPYTLAAPKELIYNFTAGVVQDSIKSRFARTDFNFGISRLLSVSAGLEYLSSSLSNPFIPFTQINFQPFSNMALNVEYAYNQNLRGLLNYNIIKNTFLLIDYTQFPANTSNKLNEVNVQFSKPFKNKFFSGSTLFNFRQSNYELFSFNQVNLSFSGYYNQFQMNTSSFVNWASGNSAQMNSIIGASYRLRNKLMLNASTGYNITENKFNIFSITLQKSLRKLNILALYSRDLLSNKNSFSVNAQYNLPFARTGFSSSYNDNDFNFSENAQGSLMFGGDNTLVQTRNNSAIGKGGILLHPFLDVNQNGTFDKDEKRVLLSSVNVPGAKAVISKKDKIIRILDLNAFVNYTIEFSDTSLDYISYNFKNKIYQVMVDPNQYKRVFIPIIVVGEISGTVSLKKGKNTEGQGRITLQIFDEKENKIAETLSEFDGYYSYLGLNPGKYTVRVDPAQLKALNYQALPIAHEIVIRASEDGDIIDNLDFIIQSKKKIVEQIDLQKDTIKVGAIEENATNEERLKSGLMLDLKKTFQEDIKRNIGNTVKLENKIIDSSFTNITYTKRLIYTIQIGAYRNTITSKQLLNLSPIYYESLNNISIRCLFGDFKTLKEAKIVKNKIKALGIQDAFVVAYKDGHRVHVKTHIRIMK